MLSLCVRQREEGGGADGTPLLRFTKRLDDTEGQLVDLPAHRGKFVPKTPVVVITYARGHCPGIPTRDNKFFMKLLGCTHFFAFVAHHSATVLDLKADKCSP